MRLSVEAQRYESAKEEQLWLAIANDAIRNVEDDIRSVLLEKRREQGR